MPYTIQIRGNVKRDDRNRFQVGDTITKQGSVFVVERPGREALTFTTDQSDRIYTFARDGYRGEFALTPDGGTLFATISYKKPVPAPDDEDTEVFVATGGDT